MNRTSTLVDVKSFGHYDKIMKSKTREKILLEIIYITIIIWLSVVITIKNNYDNMQSSWGRAGLGSLNHGAAGKRPIKFGGLFTEGRRPIREAVLPIRKTAS